MLSNKIKTSGRTSQTGTRTREDSSMIQKTKVSIYFNRPHSKSTTSIRRYGMSRVLRPWSKHLRPAPNEASKENRHYCVERRRARTHKTMQHPRFRQQQWLPCGGCPGRLVAYVSNTNKIPPVLTRHNRINTFTSHMYHTRSSSGRCATKIPQKRDTHKHNIQKIKQKDSRTRVLPVTRASSLFL